MRRGTRLKSRGTTGTCAVFSILALSTACAKSVEPDEYDIECRSITGCLLNEARDELTAYREQANPETLEALNVRLARCSTQTCLLGIECDYVACDLMTCHAPLREVTQTAIDALFACVPDQTTGECEDAKDACDDL